MRTPGPRAALVLACFLSVPLLYNACGAVGQTAINVGLSSLDSSSCHQTASFTLENGRVVARAARPRVQSVFAARKARLSDVTVESAVKGSTAPDASILYPAGTDLAVIVSGACLREHADQLDQALISHAALTSGALRPDLDDQAFRWTLPKAMTEADISAVADTEACVTGVGLDHAYGRGSLSLNDPKRADQTYLTFDQADAAYNLAFGSPGLATTGSNVIVAVLDSGVDYTHPDLASKMVAGYGADVANNTADPIDVSSEGHGTHVAGMIAAASNNAIGISGVMPFRAQILAVRIFASASSSTSSQQVYTGVQYAISKGAAVINLSIASVVSGARSDAVLQSAMQSAVDAGITVVIALGNSGTLADGVNTSTLPAQYSTIAGVLGVGAVDYATGLRSSFSTYGTTYGEISAVGAESGTTGVLSTVPAAIDGTGYGRLAGTSQATPQVTAAAALAIAMIRNAYNGASPEPAAIESLLLDSSDKVSGLTSSFRDGNRLNLNKLVQLVRQRYPLTTSVSTGC